MAKSFLETLLGGVKDLTAGQSAGDLAGKARGAWDGQSTMAKGAIAGGLLAALLTGGGRRMIGTGVKLGGAALIGGLAFKAYEDWKSGKSADAVTKDGPVALPEPDGTFLPQDAGEAEALSGRLLQAMIAAAKADGEVDPDERARIVARLKTVGAEDNALRFVEEELAKPVDLYSITAEVRDAATAAEVYAASLAAIQTDTEAERKYLDNLALRLGLDRDAVDGLHRRLGSEGARPS